MIKSSNAANTLFDQIEESIRIVLASYKIRAWVISLHNYAPRHSPKDAKDTIRIRTLGDFNISWKEAVSDIYYGIVEQAAISAHIQMRVEICNEDKMYMDTSYFIKDDTAIHSIARIQPSVLGAVMEHCPGKWTSIAYHNRGAPHYNSEKRITAIVYIRPGAIHAWGELEERIINAIQSAGFPADIDISVEILPGQISLTQSYSDRPLDYHGVSYLPMVPSNGSSIAPSNCIDAAGTLGPVVNYCAAGKEEVKKCFLTCYNVIASGDLAGKEINDSHGIGINGREIDSQIDVDYPAKYDANETWRIHTAFIESGKGSKRDFEVLKRLDDIAAQGPIGQVKFASWNRLTYTNHRMDWALIELDPARPVKNVLPMEDRFKGDHLYGIPEYMVKEGDTVSGTSNSLRSKWYGKVGRTSRCTGAEQSLIKRAIAWDDGAVSHEYEFKSANSYDRFAQVGDSGSLVFNLEKEWVGMLFAMEWSMGIGFVTPAFELLRDIEETTGGTITLA